MVLLYFFLTKTKMGTMMRAVAQNKTSAALMGIKVSFTVALAFLVSSSMAAVAGITIAPIFWCTLDMGFMFMLRGFAAAVVGGFGSFPGAILAGLGMGVIEVLATAYLSGVYKDGYVFLILILALCIKPQGIFGEKIAEKV